MNHSNFSADGDAAKEAFATMKAATDTANDALNSYSKDLDHVVPWKSFKEVIKFLETTFADYSRLSGDHVNVILRHLNKTADEYNKTTDSIRQWCSFAKPLLEKYVSLFDGADETKQMQQNRLLASVLEKQKQQLETAQTALDSCAVNLNSTAQFSTLLGTRLNYEFDENGEYFRNKLAEMLQKIDDSKSKMCQWNACFGSSSSNTAPIEEKLIDEMKKKFSLIRESHEKLRAEVNQAFIDINEFKLKVNVKIQAIGEQITRVGEIKTYAIDDHTTKIRNNAIESANRLITNCKEFLNSQRVELK